MSSQTTSKTGQCVYAHPFINSKTHKLGYECCVNNKKEYPTVDQCESCPKFKSRSIQYPITVNKIEYDQMLSDKTGKPNIGTLCEVRVIDENQVEHQHIGIYLGNLPIMLGTAYNKENEKLTVREVGSPAFYVPELHKIVYGAESFWQPLDSDITAIDPDGQLLADYLARKDK